MPYLGLSGTVLEQTNERTAILVIFHLLKNIVRKDKYSIKHTMCLLFVCREQTWNNGQQHEGKNKKIEKLQATQSTFLPWRWGWFYCCFRHCRLGCKPSGI